MNQARSAWYRLFLDRGRPVDDDRERRHAGLLGCRVHQESLSILRHGVRCLLELAGAPVRKRV